MIGFQKYNPIFIVSAGRSGSTLLRRLLMQHFKISIPPETYDFIPTFYTFYINNQKKSWNELSLTLSGIYNSHYFSKDWHIQEIEVRDVLLKLPSDRRNLNSAIEAIYLLYNSKHGIGQDLNTWGDKTPYLIYYLDWLNLIFPNCKIINIVRDPIDVVSSRVKNFNESVEEAVLRWKSSQRSAIKYKKKNNNIIFIRYEDLTTSPDFIYRDLENFLGIKFIPTSDQPILMDDNFQHHKNVREEVTSKYVGKGASFLSQNEVEFINKKLGKYLKYFNYIN